MRSVVTHQQIVVFTAQGGICPGQRPLWAV